MSSIAFKKMGSWISEEFADVFGDFGLLVQTGAIAIIGLFLLNSVTKVAVASGGSFSIFLGLTLYFVSSAIIAAAMLQASKARLHDRVPRFMDAIPDPKSALNCCAIYLFYGLFTVIPFLFFLLMGLIALIADPFQQAMEGYTQSMTYNPDTGDVVMGERVPTEGTSSSSYGTQSLLYFSMSAFFGLLSVLTLPFLFFTMAAIVDKRINFLSAAQESFTPVLKDYPGLVIFTTIWVGTYSIVVIAEKMCFPFFLLYFLVFPIWWGMIMRSYRDYFGLSTDWVLEAELQATGYYEDLERTRQEKALREQYGGANQDEAYEELAKRGTPKFQNEHVGYAERERLERERQAAQEENQDRQSRPMPPPSFHSSPAQQPPPSSPAPPPPDPFAQPEPPSTGSGIRSLPIPKKYIEREKLRASGEIFLPDGYSAEPPPVFGNRPPTPPPPPTSEEPPTAPSGYLPPERESEPLIPPLPKDDLTPQVWGGGQPDHLRQNPELDTVPNQDELKSSLEEPHHDLPTRVEVPKPNIDGFDDKPEPPSLETDLKQPGHNLPTRDNVPKANFDGYTDEVEPPSLESEPAQTYHDLPTRMHIPKPKLRPDEFDPGAGPEEDSSKKYDELPTRLDVPMQRFSGDEFDSKEVPKYNRETGPAKPSFPFAPQKEKQPKPPASPRKPPPVPPQPPKNDEDDEEFFPPPPPPPA